MPESPESENPDVRSLPSSAPRRYRIDPVDPNGQLVGLAASLLAEYISGAYTHDTQISQWRPHDRIALAAVGPARDATPGAEDFLGFWMATTLPPQPGEPAGIVGLKRRPDWDTTLDLGDGTEITRTEAVELTRLYVRRDHRGTGVVEKLIAAVIDRTVELGSQLYLTAYAVDESRAEWTSPDAITSRHRARAVYRSLGFVEDGHPVPEGLDRMIYRPAPAAAAQPTERGVPKIA